MTTTNEYLESIKSEGVQRYFDIFSRKKVTTSPIGSKLLSIATATLAERIEKFWEELSRYSHRPWKPALDSVGSPQQQALVAMRCFLDMLPLSPTFSRLSGEIGVRLDDEAWSRRVESSCRLKWKQMVDKCEGMAVWEFRGAVDALGKSEGLIREPWPRETKQACGMFLMKLIELGGLSYRKPVKTANGHYAKLIMATPELEQFLEEGHQHYSELSLRWKPCPIKPDWQPTTSLHEKPDLPAPRKLQEQSWQISPLMVEIVQEIYRRGNSPLLPPPEDLPKPPRPQVLIDEEDYEGGTMDPNHSDKFRMALKEYRIASNWTYKANRSNTGKRLGYLRSLADLTACPEGDFYLPTNVDFRGRVYYSPTTVSPQGPEHARCCIIFGSDQEGGDVDHQWVSAALVAYYGEGLNEDIIRKVRQDPIGNRALWETCKKPWQFLQACVHRYDSCLPLSLDASNHGLQLMAALTKDPAAMDITNLTSAVKRDIYSEIGNAVLPGLPRDTWKHPVMTLPYGASARKWVWHMYDQPELNGFKFAKYWEIARELHDEIRKQLPWAITMLDFFKTVGKKAEGPLFWELPAGFTVKVDYREHKEKTFRTRLFGSVVSSAYAIPGEKMSSRSMGKSLMPHIIHSLDASLLHSAVDLLNDGVPIGTAHDRFITTSEHMSYLQEHLISNAHLELSLPLLETICKDLGVDPPEGFPVTDNEITISQHMYSL